MFGLNSMESTSMMKLSAFKRLAACGVLALSIYATPSGTTAEAAPVVWGAAQNISGDGDVDTSGSLVYAYRFGGTLTGTTTVSGVPFQPVNVPSSPNETGTVTVGNVTLTSIGRGVYPGVMYPVSGMTSGSAPYASLSVSYQSLLGNAIISSLFDTARGAALQIELGGLTPGNSYSVQWWSCTTQFFRFQTVGQGSPNVTLDSNTTDTDGGVGQYAIGTFTASGPSMTISLEGLVMDAPLFEQPTINALQVRTVSVPEPSACVMASAGLACGAITIVRRRKRD